MREWERASFQMNTRPIEVERDVRREDLLTPSLFPLLLITFVGFDLGPWLMGSVLVGAIACAIALYVSKIRAQQDFLNEL